MCTAINYTNGDHYFGRNLDFEIQFPTKVVVTPENYPFSFRHVNDLYTHYPMVGIAMMHEDFPLYFEAINNKGLGMAGLRFEGLAHYYKPEENKINLATFEIIPYILGQCSTVEEAKEILKNVNITDDDVDSITLSSPLHWLIGDKNGSIVVESTASGLHVYDNPFNVLTNCPTFPYMRDNLSNYAGLSSLNPRITFAPDAKGIIEYSRGLGTVGLPGGIDSVSRFVRVAFNLLNSRCDKNEKKNVAEYFRLLNSVAQTSGVDQVEPGHFEITLYSACGNTDKGVYYFQTYYNPDILCVDMNKVDLKANKPYSYEIPLELDVTCIN